MEKLLEQLNTVITSLIEMNDIDPNSVIWMEKANELYNLFDEYSKGNIDINIDYKYLQKIEFFITSYNNRDKL